MSRGEKCLLYRVKGRAKGMGLNPDQVTCPQAGFCGSREIGACPPSRSDVFNARLEAGITNSKRA